MIIYSAVMFIYNILTFRGTVGLAEMSGCPSDAGRFYSGDRFTELFSLDLMVNCPVLS